MIDEVEHAYEELPVKVRAIRWTGSNPGAVLIFGQNGIREYGSEGALHIRRGTPEADFWELIMVGSWLVKDDDTGRLRVVPHEVFCSTFSRTD